MPLETWFIFDLGNTVIKLAYERVLENICRNASMKRDALVDLLEKPGGYRDLESGAITFVDFYEFLCEKAGYRGSLRDFQALWADFFDGPMPGIEDLLERVRALPGGLPLELERGARRGHPAEVRGHLPARRPLRLLAPLPLREARSGDLPPRPRGHRRAAASDDFRRRHGRERDRRARAGDEGVSVRRRAVADGGAGARRIAVALRISGHDGPPLRD